MPKSGSILLLADQPCLRLGFAQALKNTLPPDILVLDAEDLNSACLLVNAHNPGLVIVDISGPNISLVELVRLTQSTEITPKILVVCPYCEPYLVQKAFETKASGYILSSTTAEKLAKAVTTMLAGDHYIDPALVPRFIGSSNRPDATLHRSFIGRPLVKVTPREIDVLKRTAQGYSAKEIARDLGLSQKSVETYKARGAAKLSLESRAQIVRFATDAGWFALAH